MNDVDIVVEIDGKELLMNDFVKKILTGMITGSIATLRGVDEDWKTLKIVIKK